MVGEHNLHSAQEEYSDRGGGGGLCLTQLLCSDEEARKGIDAQKQESWHSRHS